MSVLTLARSGRQIQQGDAVFHSADAKKPAYAMIVEANDQLHVGWLITRYADPAFSSGLYSNPPSALYFPEEVGVDPAEIVDKSPRARFKIGSRVVRKSDAGVASAAKRCDSLVHSGLIVVILGAQPGYYGSKTHYGKARVAWHGTQQRRLGGTKDMETTVLLDSLLLWEEV